MHPSRCFLPDASSHAPPPRCLLPDAFSSPKRILPDASSLKDFVAEEVVIGVDACSPTLTQLSVPDDGADTLGSPPSDDVREMLQRLQEQEIELATLRQHVLDLELIAKFST